MHEYPYTDCSDEEIFQIMANAQTTLWEATMALEPRLGFDIDTTDDFEEMSLDDLKEKYWNKHY